MIKAGEWLIEGRPALSDLHTDDDTLNGEIFFHNDALKSNINVDFNATGELISDVPSTYESPGDKESTSHINIENIFYFINDGEEENVIKVTDEIEKIIIDIIYKISQ